MKIFKKTVAIILSFILICTVFSACSSEENNKTNTTESTNAASNTTATSTTAVTNEKQTTKNGETSEVQKNNSGIDIEIGGFSFELSAGNSKNSSDSNKTNNNSSTGKKSGYTVKALQSKGSSHNLHGEVYIPDNISGKAPAVVLAHSYMLNGSSLSTYAKLFAENGFVAYTFDFWGGSSNSQSGGNMNDMTVFTEKDDVTSALSTVRSLSYVDKNRVFLLGTSLGGCAAALSANDNSSKIKGLILLYPALISQELAKQWSKMSSYFGINWIKNLAEFDVFKNIGNYKGDVLILHGTADTQVPIRFSERAVNVYKSAKLVKINGARHDFSKNNKTANNEMLKFLKNHI